VAALADRAAALASAEQAALELSQASAAWRAECSKLRENLVCEALLNQRLSFHAAQVKDELLECRGKHAEVGGRGGGVAGLAAARAAGASRPAGMGACGGGIACGDS
jgi:hypothetical protein